MRRRRRAQPVLEDNEWRALLQAHPLCRVLSCSDLGVLRRRTEELLRRLRIDVAPDAAAAGGFARAVAGGGDETGRGRTGAADERRRAEEWLRRSVALQAAMPVLHLGGGWYAPVRSIYVVPRYYRTDTHYVDEAGVVHEEEVEAAGEMALQGPVVLSAADVLSSGLRHGHNVVIHEMAHVLDLSNGDLDGVPALANREAAARWRRGLEEAYIEHCRRSRRRGSAPVRRRVPRPVVEPAGAENPAEFFAYAAELFFERPGALGRAHPELFDAFVSFFGVHPWNAER